jgi:MFS transporter, YNFM family, putative membrane transport protein
MELPDKAEHLIDHNKPVTPEASIGLLLLILGLCSFSATVSMRLIDPIVPLIASEFLMSLTQVAMLSPIFTLSYAIGQPFIGPLADSLGKVRIIAYSLAVLALLQLAAYFAPDFTTLAILRGLAGIAAGGIIPVAMAAVADRVPMADRQVALSRVLAAMVMGQVAGSFLSGSIGDIWGWRIALLAPAIIVGLSALLTFLVLKPRPNATRQSLDLPSVLGRYGIVFANPKSWRLCLLVAVECMSVFAVFPFMAELLQSRGARGATEAGTALAMFGFGGLLYTTFATSFVGKLGPARMAIVGGITLASVLVLLSMPLPRWTAPLLIGFHGFGFFLIHSSYQTEATELSPTARSSSMAIFASALFIGTATGPTAIAILRQWMPLENTLLVFAGILCALGFASGPMLGLSKDQRPR